MQLCACAVYYCGGDGAYSLLIQRSNGTAKVIGEAGIGDREWRKMKLPTDISNRERGNCDKLTF